MRTAGDIASTCPEQLLGKPTRSGDGRNQRLWLVWAAVIVLVLPGPASAAPIIRVDSVSAEPGASSFLDVFLEIPTGESIDLAAFVVNLAIPTSVDATLASATKTEPLGTAYVFGISPTFSSLGFVPFVSPVVDTPITVLFTDTLFSAFQLPLVGPRTTGLGRVLFDVAANAAVGTTIPVTLQIGTSLSDGFGNVIPFVSQNGSIEVVPRSVGGIIPEPSTRSPVWDWYPVDGAADGQGAAKTQTTRAGNSTFPGNRLEFRGFSNFSSSKILD